MKKEDAFLIVKQTIDEAIKKGVIPNIETAQQIIIAMGIISSELKNKEN